VKLDAVHDLQAVFRELMLAVAFPGSERRIGEEASRIDIDAPLPKSLLVVALALLDAETSFALAPDDEVAASFLARMTYARRVPLSEADFVFVPGGEGNIARAIAEAREGTLIDPHLGATIVALVDSLGSGPAIGLSGPGIESRAELRAGSSAPWLAARERKNREYPLGVDLYLVDVSGGIAALPRATRAVMEER
jgi:alpha-D-ribose 1-methylphosphonate 5-triphosphate synthase subunit PhnH